MSCSADKHHACLSSRASKGQIFRPWWHGGVICQIYPRSWCDSNSDGIGDLRGVIDKIDYLQWLGIDGMEEMVKYYGNGKDEFDSAWNLPFLRSRFAASPLRQVIERTYRLMPDEAWPAWAMSTHDSEGRGPTRWCRGVPNAIRCALMILLTLRGTPILYYGDEIGMTEPPPHVMRRTRRDKTQSRGSWDASRTPMQWSVKPGAGFTASPPDAWMPIGDTTAANVEVQMADRQSILWLLHDLLALRRNVCDLAVGALSFMPSPAGTLAWRRGGSAYVAVNLGARMHRVKIEGKIAICSDRERDGERVEKWLELRPFEAAVVRATAATG